MPAPYTLEHRDALERRYDGPIPPADPAAVTIPADGRAGLFLRLAAETRKQVAARRATLAVTHLGTDDRLGRLHRRLAHYRHAGLAWREHAAAIRR